METVCEFCEAKVPGDAWACPSCGAPLARSARPAPAPSQPIAAAGSPAIADSGSSPKKARGSRSPLKAVLRFIGYVVVFFPLTWVLAWPVQGVLFLAVGSEKTHQLYESGSVMRIAAAIAIGILLWRWFRRR